MSDATEAIEDIVDALSEYGTAVTLKSITKGIFNPTTGEHAETIVSTSLKGLVRSYTSFELLNSDIRVDDLKFLLYTTAEISYNDTLVFLGSEYTILNIDKKILQGENLYYIVQGRK